MLRKTFRAICGVICLVSFSGLPSSSSVFGTFHDPFSRSCSLRTVGWTLPQPPWPFGAFSLALGSSFCSSDAGSSVSQLVMGLQILCTASKRRLGSRRRMA